MQFNNLTARMQIRNAVYRNRILTAPVNQPFYLERGMLSAEARVHLLEQAKGGAAQVTIGEQPVDPAHAAGKGFDVLGERIPPDVERNLASYVVEIHNYGALASIELGHPGAGVRYPPGVPGIVYSASSFVAPDGVHVIEMDEALMDQVCAMFVHAAKRYQYLGFDGVVIHSAHGCLLAQFLSALTNHRTDAYGGSLENRMRYPVRVIKAVRDAVGEDFLIELRISGSECLDGGITPEDNIAYCNALEGIIDIVHVSAGVYSDPRLFTRVHPSIYETNGCNADIAARIRRGIKTPVAVVGGINSPELAEDILASGKADFVAMGRQHIADPRFAQKVISGRTDEIATCVRCLNCMDISHPGQVLLCTVNPRAGRLISTPVEYPAAETPRSVVVIGGGPAGMKAAITAKRCGHDVTLLEKSDALGGRIRFSAHDAHKGDLNHLMRQLIRQTAAAGVDVRLNTEATADMVAAMHPYAVISAVGSEPAVPPIPGIDLPQVRHVLAAYQAPETIGNRVIIVGGGMVGCEVAIHLAETGHQVTILEQAPEVAADCGQPNRGALLHKLYDNVSVMTETRCMGFTADSVKYTGETGDVMTMEADTVLYALGMTACTGLADQFSGISPYYAAVGDCIKAGKVLQAIHQGYYAALNI